MINKNLPIDKMFLFAVIQLIAYGALMMYSASSYIGEQKFGNHLHYLIMHAKWIAIGIVAYQLVSKLKYRQLKTIIPIIVISTWIIMILAFFLNTGKEPSRWLIINGKSWMTTSDMARIMLIIYTAYFIEKHADNLKNLKFMITRFTPIPLITLLIIIRQPDLSSTVIIGSIILCMLLIAKVSYKYIGLIILLGSMLVLYKISTTDYMYNRITTWSSNEIIDNQQKKSIMALGSGGAFGKGLGNSELKNGRLPAAHTDFIFSVIGEEYGFFLGTGYIFLIFMLIFHLGIQTIKIAPDRFSLFLSLGVIINIIFYFLINVAYVIGYAPNTGLSLPFISYGGSNTIFTLIGIGLLVNISRDSQKFKNA